MDRPAPFSFELPSFLFSKDASHILLWNFLRRSMRTLLCMELLETLREGAIWRFPFFYKVARSPFSAEHLMHGQQ